MALTKEQKHRILREVYRNYLTYRAYIEHGADSLFGGMGGAGTDNEFIEHKGVTISFSDLKQGVAELSDRKREAFFYNVILDWKQKDVAEHMGITTVSVGQYVEQAMIQLAKRYFAEDDPNNGTHRTVNDRGN